MDFKTLSESRYSARSFSTVPVEQAKLEARAQAAKIIVSKGAEILSYEACRARIEAGQREEG